MPKKSKRKQKTTHKLVCMVPQVQLLHKGLYVQGGGGMTAVRAATAVIAQGRMTGGEESVNQFADCRVATACCFAGRTADVGSAAVLEKVLEKVLGLVKGMEKG